MTATDITVRDYESSDAEHVNRIAVAAFSQFSEQYEDWPAMRANLANVAYDDLYKVCEHYFGGPRRSGTSHAVFKTPWEGDPRVNIQSKKGQAKPYQVRQVIKAIDAMEVMRKKGDS